MKGKLMPMDKAEQRDEELTLVIPPPSQQDLRYIIHALGLNENRPEDVGEAIGAALSMEAIILGAAERGAQVFIIDKDGRRHEVLPKEWGETADGGLARQD